jgi:lipopolysaccharide export system protein LptA
MEYWSATRMSVARGRAVLVTNDARRIDADTLVGYSEQATAATAPPAATKVAAKPGADPLLSAGKLQRVEAFGNVVLRTPTDTVYADRGVYVPDTGMSRVVGHVRVTRGQNQLNGPAADVNMKTGIATMLSNASQRVEGLIVPNDTQSGPGGKPGGRAP